MHVEQSIEIGRPLPEVFDYVADVTNYPRWMAHVLEVRKESAGAPQRGDRFTVAIRSVGRRFDTPYERISSEPNRHCTDRAVGGPVPDQQWRTVFSEGPEGTRVTRAVNAKMDGLLTLLEPVQRRAAERQLRKDLEVLKEVLEGQVPGR